jgi:hypothetical protein
MATYITSIIAPMISPGPEKIKLSTAPIIAIYIMPRRIMPIKSRNTKIRKHIIRIIKIIPIASTLPNNYLTHYTKVFNIL